MGLPGSRRSPPVRLVQTHTEPEPLRSTGITRFHHYYELLRLLPWPAPDRAVAPQRRTAADLPCFVLVFLCVLRPHTPVDPCRRFGSPNDTSMVFAVIRAARPPR